MSSAELCLLVDVAASYAGGDMSRRPTGYGAPGPVPAPVPPPSYQYPPQGPSYQGPQYGSGGSYDVNSASYPSAVCC